MKRVIAEGILITVVSGLILMTFSAFSKINVNVSMVRNNERTIEKMREEYFKNMQKQTDVWIQINSRLGNIEGILREVKKK